MVYNDYLRNVTERDMQKFLEEEMGASVESVIKYYDEAYGGYLFQVKMDGYYNLPREDGGILRFGKFGLVEDDVSNPVPTTYEAYDTMLNNPNTLKKYVLFINKMVDDNPKHANSYIKRFVNDYACYCLSNKNGKNKQAEQNYNQKKKLLFDIQYEATLLQKEPESCQ